MLGCTGALEKHWLVELVTIVDCQGKKPQQFPNNGGYDAEDLLAAAAARQKMGLHRPQHPDVMMYLQTWSIVAVALFEHPVRSNLLQQSRNSKGPS